MQQHPDRYKFRCGQGGEYVDCMNLNKFHLVTGGKSRTFSVFLAVCLSFLLRLDYLSLCLTHTKRWTITYLGQLQHSTKLYETIYHSGIPAFHWQLTIRFRENQISRHPRLQSVILQCYIVAG